MGKDEYSVVIEIRMLSPATVVRRWSMKMEHLIRESCLCSLEVNILYSRMCFFYPYYNSTP